MNKPYLLSNKFNNILVFSFLRPLLALLGTPVFYKTVLTLYNCWILTNSQSSLIIARPSLTQFKGLVQYKYTNLRKH